MGQAQFAQIDENNKVLNVVAIDDSIPADGGTLAEHPCSIDGEIYCQNLFGGNIWKQSFLNGEYRKQPAQKFGSYDFVKDIFINEKPFNSWVLNANNDWVAPVAYPSITVWDSQDVYPIVWNEVDLRWQGYTREEKVPLIWNNSTLSWQLA